MISLESMATTLYPTFNSHTHTYIASSITCMIFCIKFVIHRPKGGPEVLLFPPSSQNSIT